MDWLISLFGGAADLLGGWLFGGLKIALAAIPAIGYAAVAYFRSRKSQKLFTVKDAVILLVIGAILFLVLWVG
ncbi:MAG: hypothetical protein FVQ81_13220 [Candidatus Glassbacteria bacterium]|nr:hypothetical protein [Candidatus Glassbacteria bacterium]